MSDAIGTIRQLWGGFFALVMANPVLWMGIAAAAVAARWSVKKDVDRKDGIAFAIFWGVTLWIATNSWKYAPRQNDEPVAFIIVILLVWAVALALPQPDSDSKWVDPTNGAGGGGVPMMRYSNKGRGHFVTGYGPQNVSPAIFWFMEADRKRLAFYGWFVGTIVSLLFLGFFPPLFFIVALWFMWKAGQYFWWLWRRDRYRQRYTPYTAAPADNTARQQTQRQRLGGRRDLD